MAYPTDTTLGGFSFKRLLTPPRALRKLQPLKLLGKIARPAIAVATGGIGAAIGAGLGVLGQGAREEAVNIASQIPEVQQAEQAYARERITQVGSKMLPIVLAGVAVALLTRRR